MFPKSRSSTPLCDPTRSVLLITAFKHPGATGNGITKSQRHLWKFQTCKTNEYMNSVRYLRELGLRCPDSTCIQPHTGNGSFSIMCMLTVSSLAVQTTCSSTERCFGVQNYCSDDQQDAPLKVFVTYTSLVFTQLNRSGEETT